MSKLDVMQRYAEQLLRRAEVDRTVTVQWSGTTCKLGRRTLAHAHLDTGVICVRRGLQDWRSTMRHEVAHLLPGGGAPLKDLSDKWREREASVDTWDERRGIKQCREDLERALSQQERPVLRHFCGGDMDRLYPHGTVFEDCPLCATYSQDYQRLLAEQVLGEPEEQSALPECDGSGYITAEVWNDKPSADGYVHGSKTVHPCPGCTRCQGGDVPSETGTPCARCEGSGATCGSNLCARDNSKHRCPNGCPPACDGDGTVEHWLGGTYQLHEISGCPACRGVEGAAQ